MANIPTTTLFSKTDDTIDLTTNGSYWILDSNKTMTWSMSQGLTGEGWIDQAYYKAVFGGIFETISQYIDVDFDYAGSFSDPHEAYAGGSNFDISITTFDKTGWAAAQCGFPYLQWEDYAGASGDLFVNGADMLSNGPTEPGSWNWSLFLHEIGHGLGLRHPHDDGGTGRPTFIEAEVENFDSELFTIMSYVPVKDSSGATYKPSTPMFLDILALQDIYGKNLETNSGNNTHPLEVCNQFQTIWDASGKDTVDASSASAGWEIQLPNMKFSSRTDTLTGYACIETEDESTLPTTLYWLMGDIENATGSEFLDDMQGNEANNIFIGNGGDDLINGSPGIDTARYFGIRSNYSLTKTSQGHTVIDQVGKEGTDSLVNIERLSFLDTDFALDTGENENAGMAYRLYKAAFDRTPDDSGLNHWIIQLDTGMALGEISESFIASDEFKELYGNAPSSQDFVGSLYQNVLGRGGDAQGIAYWVSSLDSGISTQAEVLAGFSESQENIQLVGVTIDNGFAFNFSAGNG